MSRFLCLGDLSPLRRRTTRANQLSLNSDKTQILLMTKDQSYKDKFQVILNNKIIKHQKEATVLGNLISENLTWEAHVIKKLIPALRNRIRTMRLVTKYMDQGYRAIYSNAAFRSKLMFGLETWGGGHL